MSKHEFAVCIDTTKRTYKPPEPAVVDSMRGPKWLRRALNYVLRSLGAVAQPTLEPVNVRTFKAPDGSFLERLGLQQRDMMRIYNQEARVVFIGPDYWSEAERDLLMLTRVMHLPPVEAKIGGPSGIVYRGIEFVYVPWMTGALLVPDWRSK